MTRLSQIEVDAHMARMQGFHEQPHQDIKIKPKPIIPESTMNKTEARFADYLEQLKHMKQLVDWKFEPIKFILAQNVGGKRNATTYRPDFLVVYPDRFVFYEVKGFFRDDAKVKIKVAADLFPWFEWNVVFLKKGQWVFEAV